MKNKLLGFFAEHRFALLGTLVYAVIVIALSCVHEVWRDEVIFMTMAAESRSLSELFAGLRNYGHPGLWSFLLYIGYQIVPHFVILKIVNLGIAIAAMFVFLTYSPFSRLQKILFMCGFFPLYLYPVVNRDYGISMLLVFLFCMLYDKRFERFVLLGIVLFLLANSHMHSMLLVCAILASLVIEFVTSRESRRAWLSKPIDVYIGFGLIVLGIICSSIQIMPDETSNAVHPHNTLRHIAGSIVKTFLMPGQAFPDILGFKAGIVLHLLVWALVIYFTKNRNLFIIFGGYLIALGLFFHMIFPSIAMRHQGAFFILLILVMWLDQTVRTPREVLLIQPLNVIREFVGQKKDIFLSLLLVAHIVMAVPAVRDDIYLPYSSSRRLVEFLDHNAELRNAVIIPEPDTFAEAITYYTDRHRIYFPREGRFGKYTHLTTECRSEYSLPELLSVARRIKEMTGQPVVIILGHRLSFMGPFKIFFSWSTHKYFYYSPESLRNFHAQTVKIASFHPSITDEEYDLYLLK